MEKPVVFATKNSIPQSAIDILSKKCELLLWKDNDSIPKADLIEQVSKADGILCINTQIDAEVLNAAPRLKVIGTLSVGLEHIDLEACKKRNIAVGFTPDLVTETTAELAVGLLLCTSRRLVEASNDVHRGGWTTWHCFYMAGTGLVNSVVGIIGLGRIGKSIAEKLKAFRPKEILYHNRRPNPEAAASTNAKYVCLDYLLANSDFVILSCAANDETKGLMNKATFELMKPTAILINVARGSIINHDDLYDVLKTKRIKAAGLDVTDPEPLPKDHKLLTLDNIVITPHIGSAVRETRSRMGQLTAENILAGLSGQKLPAPAI